MLNYQVLTQKNKFEVFYFSSRHNSLFCFSPLETIWKHFIFTIYNALKIKVFFCAPANAAGGLTIDYLFPVCDSNATSHPEHGNKGVQ